LDQTVTAGIISATGRKTHMVGDGYENFLQTDAAINHGNSGGPLVDMSGEVIGINTMIVSRSGAYAGIGLSIPSNLAKNVMNQLIAKGKVVRGYMGIRFRDVDGQVKVFQVLGGSPAEKAGVRVRDAIKELDGKELKDGEDFRFRIAGMDPGSEHKLSVLRDGKTVTLTVTLGELPDEGSAAEDEGEIPPASVEKLGLKVSDLTAELAKEYGYKEGTKGVAITEVRSRAAAGLGVKPGMLVKKVGEAAVRTTAEFAAALAKSNLAEGVEFRLEDAKGAGMSVLLAAETQEDKPGEE